MGMSLFGEVPESTYITDQANFRNFWRAFILLIRMVTGTRCFGLAATLRATEPHSCLLSGAMADVGVQGSLGTGSCTT